MIELVAGVAVAIAALVVIFEPLARPPSEPAVDLDDEGTPLEESDSPKVQALLALKEIEFDRATGKLSETDFEQLRARYARQALEAIDAEASVNALLEATATADDPAEALIAVARATVVRCPTCGPRPEADASFCSECGRSLGRPVT